MKRSNYIIFKKQAYENRKRTNRTNLKIIQNKAKSSRGNHIQKTVFVIILLIIGRMILWLVKKTFYSNNFNYVVIMQQYFCWYTQKICIGR